MSKFLVDLVFKTSKDVKQTKKHDSIVKMTIFSLKNGLAFVSFLNFYLILSTR